MVVCMVMHVVKFVNSIPWKSGMKHYTPGEIMTDQRLHAYDLCLGFGTYCQVAKHVEPQNSLTPHTSGNLVCQFWKFVGWPGIAYIGYRPHNY